MNTKPFEGERRRRCQSSPGADEFFGNEFSSYFSIALFALILLYSESLLTGAAPAEGAISNQSWLAGETQKGLHLCGLWPPVWVPAFRGL
jgi:hypothetical protein